MKKLSQHKIYSTSSEAWDAMYQAICSAKNSIFWEMYIFVDDKEGKRFFEMLKKKAKEGVNVKLIVDQFGSFWLSRKEVKSLKDSGVDFHYFHAPLRGLKGFWERLCFRNHKKILIVDGDCGFIGGVNVCKNMKDWLDIHVMLKGKIVHSLERSFAKSYIKSGGKKEKVKHLIKRKRRKKHPTIDFIYDKPEKSKSEARKKYSEALFFAKKSVILFTPYYFPDRKFLRAMWRARKRGVKIDLLIPLRSDLWIATWASYAYFRLMDSMGVNVHVIKKKMMHAKGVIVDQDWAMIGSSNLDANSFYDQHEANVRFRDKIFVKNLTNIVKKWIEGASSIKELQWHKRGRLNKLKEWFSMRIYRIWYYNNRHLHRKDPTLLPKSFGKPNETKFFNN